MAEIKMMFSFQGPRRPPSPVENPPSAAEIASCRSEPPSRCFVWSHYKNTGFPSRVNHATAAYTAPNGKSYIYSLGGYHASAEERAKAAKSGLSDHSPTFHTGEIDLHCMDVGKCAVWEGERWEHMYSASGIHSELHTNKAAKLK